jgi:hypothetical protein
MSRVIRAERTDGADLLFIVAGEHGAVEMRETPNYHVFYVHSPVWREDLYLHRCRILETDCWTGLTGCEIYDFDRPDVHEVIQWEALEDLYRRKLGAG